MYRIRIPIGLALLGFIGLICYIDSYTQTWYATSSILSLFVLVALWELYKMFEKREYAPYTTFSIISVAIALFLHIISPKIAFVQKYKLVPIFEVFILALLLIRALFDCEKEKVIECVFCTFFGFFYIYFFLKYLLLIRVENQENGLILLFMLIMVSKSMDIGGYLLGVLIGKHKICPSISPNKSWEGFTGGIVLSIASVFLFMHFFPQIAKRFTPIIAICFAITIGILSLAGDFIESLIKRRCKVKDSNSLIPEFGGILDLVDSMILTAPAGYYFFMLP